MTTTKPRARKKVKPVKAWAHEWRADDSLFSRTGLCGSVDIPIFMTRKSAKDSAMFSASKRIVRVTIKLEPRK